MLKELPKKIIAISLVVFILLSSVSFLETVSYATGSNLEMQTTTTSNSKVEFDSYFLGDNGEKLHQKMQDTKDATGKIYFSVEVKEGYVKSSFAQISGANKGETANFSMQENQEGSENVKQVQKNKIEFNQINAGKNILIGVPIQTITTDYIHNKDFDKENKISFYGIYVTKEGKEVEIKKDIILRLQWGANIRAFVKQEVTTYAKIETENLQGVLLQTEVEVGLDKDSLPIGQYKTEVSIPVINGQKAKNIKILADHVLLEKEKYQIDTVNNILCITEQNLPDEAGNINWQHKPKHYTISYLYEKEARTQEEITWENTTKVELKVYGKEISNLQAEDKKVIQLKENMGGIVDYHTQITGSIYKGNLYRNHTQNDTIGKEDYYTVCTTAKIGHRELVDQIKMNVTDDKFISPAEDGKEKIINSTVGGIHHTYYQNTYISKNNFDAILGESGSITIYAPNGTILGTIDQNTKPNEQNYLVFTYENQDISAITLETTAPIQEGVLTINHTKAIKNHTTYSKEELQSFTALRTVVEKKKKKSNSMVSNVQTSADMKLEETKTKIETQISRTEFSTLTKNENVEMRMTLKSDGTQYDLFEDPVITIEVPDFIKQVDLKTIHLLYNEELQIKDCFLQEQDGKNMILIVIEGKQSHYQLGEFAQNPTVILTADFTVDPYTADVEEPMVFTIENKQAKFYENEGKSVVSIHTTAPKGMINVSSIETLDQQKVVTSIKQGRRVEGIKANTEAKRAYMTMNVINNTGMQADTIEILGRVPFKGNKTILNKEELDTTINTKLVDKIQARNLPENAYSVYYSTNGEASKDLSNPNNLWTTQIENIDKIKSYLIVIHGKSLAQGEELSFAYPFEVPENIGYRNAFYSTFATYFTQQTKYRSIENQQSESDVIGLQTGTGPVLSAKLELVYTQNGNQVYNHDMIGYQVKVTNTGTEVATNQTVELQNPEGCLPRVFNKNEYIAIQDENGRTILKNYGSIQSIAPGETKTTDILYVKIDKQDIRKIAMQAKVYQGSMDNEENPSRVEINSNIVETEVQENNKLDLEIATSYNTEDSIKEKSLVDYYLTVKNPGTETLNNIKVVGTIPNNATYYNASIITKNEGKTEMDSSNITISGNTVIYKIDQLQAGQSKDIELRMLTKVMGENQASNIESNFYVESPFRYQAPTIQHQIRTPNITITKEMVNPSKYVKEGENLDYKITIHNQDKSNIEEFTFTDVVPEELEIVEAKVKKASGDQTLNLYDNNEVVLYDRLEETDIIIQIRTKVKYCLETEQERQIKNKAKVSFESGREFYSNEVTNIIQLGQDHKENIRYLLEGNVWFDQNENGQIDPQEAKMENIKVGLIDATKNSFATDENGNNICVLTDEQGNYKINNLKEGKYIVVFYYPVQEYSLTTYKKKNVSEEINSDVVTSILKENGMETSVAVTDTILLQKSQSGVNMGLVKHKKFDLSLSKVVTKIRVENPKTAKEYQYHQSKLAKIDIDPKQINNTTISITYQISVKNEGEIAGTAKSVVDYLPNGFKVKEGMEWETGENGYLYNNSLGNTTINPGQTKDLILTVEKKLTENDTGIINNVAEIYRDDNVYGATDINSIPANRANGENDMDAADVMISLKTGTAIKNTMLIIFSVGSLLIGIYFIRKKVL